MNYFAHAYRFLDEAPYFVAGTAVPDWLTVADRPSRVRAKHARIGMESLDARVAAVARGALQHINDDARFHETRAFFEAVLAVNAMIRAELNGDGVSYSSFLGHLLVEVLLDASLVAEEPERLDQYYRIMDLVDPYAVQEAVNQIAPHPTERLAGMIEGFRRLEILRDYADDARLMARLNQVMHRVGLDQLPDRFRDVVPQMRQLVASRKQALLEGIALVPDRQPTINDERLAVTTDY